MLFNMLVLMRPEIWVEIRNCISGELYVEGPVGYLLYGTPTTTKASAYMTVHPEVANAEIGAWENSLDNTRAVIYIDF